MKEHPDSNGLSGAISTSAPNCSNYSTSYFSFICDRWGNIDDEWCSDSPAAPVIQAEPWPDFRDVGKIAWRLTHPARK